MKHLRSTLLFAALAVLAQAAPAAAQSDILLRLRSGSPLGDRVRVDSAGALVAMGSLGIGIIPHSGAGSRMMWYPFKSSFRVGGVDGTQWDDGSTGFYNFAAGYNVMAQGNYAFAGGYASQAQLSYGVALGYMANSNGTAAISIGYRSTADGDYSIALGQRASTNGFDGAIVISDQSSMDSLEASAANQFSVRAAGGYRLFSNATKTVGVSINAGGSSWNVISDRSRKEHFLGVDGEDILSRIRSLPVTTWQYRDEEDRTVRHIGPMAQDWNRAFGFSRDETTINMSDFDGVNLAAIQALEARTAEQAAQIGTLRTENAELRAELSGVRTQNAALEARLRRLEALAAEKP
jgi:uncharacterized coiled-coil protein SlyX